MQRIRLSYAKTEALRYTSNLDMQTIWERTLRRAALPLAYSQGFHPQPRLQQACPLPLGMLSDQEVLDFWLDPDLSLESIESALQSALPPGIQLETIQQVDLRSPAMQTQVTASDFDVLFLDPVDSVQISESIETLLHSEQLLRQRRGKTYDLRPLILELHLNPPNAKGEVWLFMRLSAREAATGRPDEVLAALGIDPFATRVIRRKLHFLPPAEPAHAA